MSILPNKLFKPKKTDYITAKELAKFFSIEPRQLKQILANIGWIEKEHYIWWVATTLGKENGAIDHNSKNSRVRYVHWHKDIMHNHELYNIVQNSIPSIENNPYEEFVKEYYTQKDYTVWYHSKEKNQQNKDKNITLLAKKNKKIMLIHCRDKQLDISIDEVKSFQQQRNNFKKDNPLFNNYDLKLHYSMSGFFMTEEAYEYIENNRDDISYEVIKGESASAWLDSLLVKRKKT